MFIGESQTKQFSTCFGIREREGEQNAAWILKSLFAIFILLKAFIMVDDITLM